MNYLIIGANAAGLSAAMRIHKLDKEAKIRILEKGDVVSFGACGIPYFVADEFSDKNTMISRTYEDFTKLGIEIKLFREVISVDKEKKSILAKNLKDNSTATFSYDKLMIASGASPRSVNMEGSKAKNFFKMHSMEDALKIKEYAKNVENVVIVGGGFIGIEAAESFAHLGKKVTVIEPNRILAQAFDNEITDLLEEELRKNGVKLARDEKLASFEVEGDLITKVKSDKNEYQADMVLLSIGFVPNTSFLEGTNIDLNSQNAVIIDLQAKTSIEDIYAAGDCATVNHFTLKDVYIPLATTANKLGRIAGENMAGLESKALKTLGSIAIRVFNLEAGKTGITEEQAKRNELDYSVVFVKDKDHTAYIAGQADMFIKIIYDKNSREILGAQTCGKYKSGAVHKIDALAIAVYKKLTVDELALMDFTYAPPFSKTYDIMNIAGNVAK